MIETDVWYQQRKYSSSCQIGEIKMKKTVEKLSFTPINTGNHSKSNKNEAVNFSSFQRKFMDHQPKDEGEEYFYLKNNKLKGKGSLTPSETKCQRTRLNSYLQTTKREEKKMMKSSFLNTLEKDVKVEENILYSNTNDEDITSSDEINYSFFEKPATSTNDSLPTQRNENSNVIQTIINEKESEIKQLTNTEEISDFYEYNECCMELMQTLKPVCAGPPQIELPFASDIPSLKRLAVFDLDETLVHALFKKIDKAQYTLKVKLPSNKIAEIGLNIRPNWKEALDLISNNYFIVVYTASDHSYANSVLNFMDPNDKYFKYRLYRNNCLTLQGKENQKIYVKDLNIFKGIDLKDIVIIDNSLLSYAYHLNNGIPILPYYDSKNDLELIFLAGYLQAIASVEDLREANKKHIQLYQLDKKEEGEAEAEAEAEGEQEVTSDEETSLANIKLIGGEANDNYSPHKTSLKKKISLYLGDFLKEFNSTSA